MTTTTESATVVPDKHWVACTDGLRHAVFGRATPHREGDLIHGMCGADTAFGRPSESYRYPFQWSHCIGCKEAVREFLESAGV